MQTQNSFFVCGVNGIGVMAEGNPINPEIFNCENIQRKALRVKSLNGQTLFSALPPRLGWTLSLVKNSISHVDTSGGADLFFGEDWLGSTEV